MQAQFVGGGGGLERPVTPGLRKMFETWTAAVPVLHYPMIIAS